MNVQETLARERADDKPVEGKAVTFDDLYGIVIHPAFRLGFLDAQHGKGFDCDDIIARIYRETPAGALGRLGWSKSDLFNDQKPSFDLAQYRYEEGRRIQSEYGLKCRAWGHPDYPPVAVMDFIRAEAKRRSSPHMTLNAKIGTA